MDSRRVDGRASRRKRGELESTVLQVLQTAGAPVTPTQVHAQIPGLAYNTVYTVLIRLHDKGSVHRVRLRGARAYTPVHNADQTAAERMRVLLDSGRDQCEILRRFVAGLSPRDIRLLRAALRMEQSSERRRI